MAAWQKTDEKSGVSVQFGTSEVPDDGRYHVLVDGELVLSTKVKNAALAEFEDVRDTRREARAKRLRSEQGAAAYRAMRSASWADKTKRNARRGGTGR